MPRIIRKHWLLKIALVIFLLPQFVLAAVSFDTSSESDAASTGSVSQASFTWNHAGAASGVKGVLVFTFVDANANNALSVTYGGVSVPAVSGGRGVDTATEPGDCKAWFLGTGVPQGTNAVVVNRTNNTNVMYAVAITIKANIDATTTGVVLLQENQALSEQNVTDGSPGTNSMRFACVNSGLATHPSAGANSTLLQFFPATAGSRSISVARETTAGQGSRPVGFTGSTDDVGAVHLAVKEAMPVVSTSAASNVTALSMTLNGNITAINSINATSRGFAWGTDSALSTVFGTTTESGSFGTGVFSQNVSGLKAGATYYFRAYATNSAGTGYGTITSQVAGTDTSVTRKMRLFEGYKIKIVGGKILINQK